MLTVSELYKGLKSNPALYALLPMGYAPGLPILSVVNSELLLTVPFLRYKVTGEADKTLVYPIRYVASFALPSTTPVRFIDLAYDPRFEGVNFNSPVGTFRHEAIRHLTRDEYAKKRAEAYACYDKVIDYMLGDGSYTEADNQRMHALLSMLVEPSLLGAYQALDKEFHDKYLKA